MRTFPRSLSLRHRKQLQKERMGLGRAIYVLIFPLFFTVVGFVLSIITFFGSYENAASLHNVNYMTIDLGKISIDGVSSKEFFDKANSSSAFSIGTNGICSGSSTTDMTSCFTPQEPFYFSFLDIVKAAGLSGITNELPDQIQDYDRISKATTLGIWGCFLATICLGALGGVCGILAMCSRIATGFSEFFVSLAFIGAALGAALATGVYHVYSNKINEIVGDVGIEASLNSTGLGIAWATAAAFLVADLFYIIASCCCISRRPKYVTVPEKNEFM